MSAIAILRQKKAIHFLTDAASYTADGVVTGIGSKVGLIENPPIAIYTRGPANTATLAARQLDGAFASFDDLIANAEDRIKCFYYVNAEHMRASGFPDLDMYLFGWSESRNCPEGYSIRCGFDDSDLHRDTDWGGIRPAPFKLHTLSALCCAPLIDQAQLPATGFPMHLKPNKLNPETDLLHLMELMRRTPSEMKPWLPKINTVGGFALLTSVSRTGITQKVLAEYSDRVGEKITPEAIDWKKWRTESARTNVNGRNAVPSLAPSRL
jgi:hypothetical protein